MCAFMYDMHIVRMHNYCACYVIVYTHALLKIRVYVNVCSRGHYHAYVYVRIYVHKAYVCVCTYNKYSNGITLLQVD